MGGTPPLAGGDIGALIVVYVWLPLFAVVLLAAALAAILYPRS